jgi:hypothetical protein
MGCDIHTYVELADGTKDKPYWRNFTRNGGERDYLMFGILAGVRVEDEQLFEPKGLPEGELGYWTEDDYWLHVAPEKNPEWADTENWISREKAEKYIGYGSKADMKDGVLKRVSHPDYHSHSWLTADEFEQAIKRYSEVVGKYYPVGQRSEAPLEWRAMLAAMRCAEAGGDLARLVFWFDN